MKKSAFLDNGIMETINNYFRFPDFVGNWGIIGRYTQPSSYGQSIV